ncbi:phosphonopyruvate decarboxylase [Massiliimalia timonensis]|uniref:phosphonopyruvate decarboxylase n=1 Tax=Massiliimalia timonensis TaxID=1987501 RepID=UPI000B8B2C31|nr:phosphonopyruvate decarboxylase [Massiliimalia timonensis]MBS7175946.1 phosphonopyruvate decarboxylase [Clostridiales bacterium]
MKITDFMTEVQKLGIDYYTGVPDSQLKALCDHLMDRFGICENHVVAANEGAATGLAAGHFLATGKPAMVYMQNSGIGNAVNPICSLLNDKVYAIPVLFVVGWRGEPGVHDEPQHIFQGEVTCEMLSCLDIAHFVLTPETTEEEFKSAMDEAAKTFASGKCYAVVVKKGALKNDKKMVYENDYPMSREDVVKLIISQAKPDDIFVSTTGKLSRELFEAREARGEGHEKDFLTVGSMGHSSMIALGIAQQKKDRRVFCLDGDGAALMHMGSMAVLGANEPKNLYHVVINNGAHETVGGVPTVSASIDLPAAAKAFGYKQAFTAQNEQEILEALSHCGEEGPILIEIHTNLFSRADLGRPTTTPIQNKEAFMGFVAGE